MKPKFIVLFAFVTAFTLTSCSEKDLYNDGEGTVAGLNVPSGFDWKMVNEVTCNFSAATETAVAIYTNSKCDDSSLVAEYVVSPNESKGLLLKLPVAVAQLYVKVGNAVTPVQIVNGVAKFAIPSTRGSEVTTRGLPGETYIYFPTKNESTWATLLFEDNFPVKGDYDFNDFVINYRYTAKLTKDEKNVDYITFKVRIKALGGLYDYKPYLRLVAANGSSNVISGEGVSQVETNPLILSIDKYTQKPAGATYLNTIRSEASKGLSEIIVIEFTVAFKDEVSQEDLGVDFFLKGPGYSGKIYEIHEKGFTATSASYYPSGPANLGSDPYTTSDGFVWGITIPKNIDHAIERANFLDAYPDFADWVQSGGANNTEWYDNGDDTYLFPLH